MTLRGLFKFYLKSQLPKAKLEWVNEDFNEAVMNGKLISINTISQAYGELEKQANIILDKLLFGMDKRVPCNAFGKLERQFNITQGFTCIPDHGDDLIRFLFTSPLLC